MIPYGSLNGKTVYSRDEFVFTSRGFGAIEDDGKLIEFAKKVSGNWYNAGHNYTFTSFYLSDYALNEPCRSLTKAEFKRLKELQKIERDKEKAKDEARQWRHVGTYYWADNSIEEIWEDKDGVQKSVMTVGPHGDVCY